MLAAGSPPPPSSAGAAVPGRALPPGFGMPGLSSAISPTDAGPGPRETAEPLPNPGAFDECHRKCKGEREGPRSLLSSATRCVTCRRVLVCAEVFPLQMEGVRLLVNKGLSNHFQVGPPFAAPASLLWAPLPSQLWPLSSR